MNKLRVLAGEMEKRRLLDDLKEVEYILEKEPDYRGYIKNLFLQLLENTPQAIVDNFESPLNFPKWQLRLIKEKDLLDEKAYTIFIAIPDDNSCCYLLKNQRPHNKRDIYKVE